MRFLLPVTLCAALFSFSQVCTGADQPEKLSDPALIELIKTAPGPKDLPNMPAVFLSLEEKDFANIDGTGIYEMHEVVKILDDQGMSLGEVSLPYDQSDSVLTIVSARTIKPDGTIVNVNEDAIREVAPYSGFPLYSYIRVKQFSMPALEIGSVIEYRALLKVFKSKMPSLFVTYWSFPPGYVIKKAHLEVDAPVEMQINYRARNIKAEPSITTEKARKLYSWNVSDVFIGGIYEQFLPPYDVVCPNIYVASAREWGDVSRWFYELSQPSLEPGQKMKDYVDYVVKGCGRDREKIMRELYDFVSQNIRYVAIPLRASGYAPHNVTDIYVNKYGDCKDKSALLISLYRLAGIDSYFALLKTRSAGPLIREFPALEFNHCIVAVPKQDGGYIFLDPTLELDRFGYVPTEMQNVDIFVVKKDAEYEFIKIPFDLKNYSGTHGTISMTIGGDYTISVKDTIEYFGDREILTRLNYKYATRDAIRAVFEKGLHSLYSDAVLDDVKISEPNDLSGHFWDSSTYRIKGHIKEAGNLLIFDLPGFDSMLRNIISTETRTYPLWFSELSHDITDITITIPASCRVNYVPVSIEKDTPFGYYNRNVKSEGNTISIHYDFRMKLLEIPAAQYAKYKEFIESIVQSMKESIVLEKVTKG